MSHHLAFPLKLSGGVFQTVPRGSVQEIEGCVEAILRTPLGWVESLPTMGVRDPTHTRPDIETLRAVVERHEPRARLLGDVQFEGVLARIRANVEVTLG